MIKKDFWLSCGTIIALSLGIALPLKPVIGQSSTAVPIRMIAFTSFPPEGPMASFQVPDSDPYSMSAYGGKLTRYDVHIAKMFEITRHECSKEYFDWRGISWEYVIDNGRREVGTLTISCQQAYQIANAYGLGQTESTQILYYKALNTVSIPILDITGAKVDRWKSFVGSL